MMADVNRAELIREIAVIRYHVSHNGQDEALHGLDAIALGLTFGGRFELEPDPCPKCGCNPKDNLSYYEAIRGCNWNEDAKACPRCLLSNKPRHKP